MTYSVMILEDDPFIALDMEGVMEDAGFDVVGPVACVSEAMALLDPNDKPDCALLDFHVKGGTTESIARELDRMGVPVLFITSERKDVEAVLSDQDVKFCPKPIHVARILRDVQALIA